MKGGKKFQVGVLHCPAHTGADRCNAVQEGRSSAGRKKKTLRGILLTLFAFPDISSSFSTQRITASTLP